MVLQDLNMTLSSSLSLYGMHLPFGQAAVSYAYDPVYGTFKEMRNIQYKWNYYEASALL